jgi:hypothetical protein
MHQMATIQNPRELNRLLSAAIVNPTFCKKLLQDPSGAIASGYHGQQFALTPEEISLVSGVKAKGLQDLAAHIAGWLTPEPSRCTAWTRMPQWEMA